MFAVANHAMLQADRYVRQGAYMTVVSLVLPAIGFALTLGDERILPWFFVGFTLGCTVPSLIGFGMLLVNTRRRMKSEQDLRKSARQIVDFVTRELDRRGVNFEAVIKPGEGLVIRHRGYGERRPWPPSPPPAKNH